MATAGNKPDPGQLHASTETWWRTQTRMGAAKGGQRARGEVRECPRRRWALQCPGGPAREGAWAGLHRRSHSMSDPIVLGSPLC